MNLSHHWTNYLGKAALTAAALTAFATFGATPSRADHNTDCQRRISKADHRLHEAIEHHGYRSSQANSARHNLAEAREHCYTRYHEWWNEDDHQWHTGRDWRDEDHENWRRQERREEERREERREDHP
jgi:hypothetical protein